jgi:hypothetical protein
MQYECMMSCNMSDLYIPHQKKKVTKYRWCMYSRWQIALILVVSSNDITYINIVSVPTEEHNIYIHIHHHLSPKWCPCVSRCMDIAAYVMITYSHLEEETTRQP